MPKGVYDRIKSNWYPPNKGKHLSLETRLKISKSHMGKVPWNKGKKMSDKYCKIMSEAQKGLQVGNKNPRWKGGIKISKGYVYIYKPNHPLAKKNYIKRSRLVMEKYLGRYIKPKEVVHHINRIENDDRISNLKLFVNQSVHSKFHSKERSRDDYCRFASKV